MQSHFVLFVFDFGGKYKWSQTDQDPVLQCLNKWPDTAPVLWLYKASESSFVVVGADSK